MKVIYLVHQFFPEHYTGTEKFIYKISSMMQRTGHKVRVITYSFYQDSFYDKNVGDILQRDFTYQGIPVTAVRHKKIPENINISLGDKSMARIAGHIISREKPDIVHVGHPMRINEFITASKLWDIPYILTLTDFWLICPKINLIDSKGDLCAGPDGGIACQNLCPEFLNDLIAQRIKLARDILSDAKRVISPSKFLASLFTKEMKFLDVMVINHGMSYHKLKRSNKTNKKGHTLVFCYAGSLNEHKGVHILIDAFKKIKSNNIILKIFGSGPNPSYTKRLFSMAKDDKRVEFCGVYSEEDVGDILSNVDIVIIPSLCFENYPLVLHEALACNTPVVVSNIGGMAERIQDGLNGFAFPVGDAEALKTVMERVISNPEILNTLRKNIRSSPPPTIEQETYSYYKIYMSLLPHGKWAL
jgi:glycosyltransferase involved in cell wall biosynthesis